MSTPERPRYIEPAPDLEYLSASFQILDYNALPIHPDMYVEELYQKHLEKLKLQLLPKRPSLLFDSPSVYPTFFLAGQTGTGKTAFLFHLLDDDLKAAYDVIYINPRDFFESEMVPEGAGIVDVLFVMGHELIKRMKAQKIQLKDYDQKLQELYELGLGSRKKTISEQEDNSLAIKIKASVLGFLSSEYKNNLLVRDETRKVLKFRLPDLLNLINEIITTYIEEASGTTKQPLILLDGWEKSRDEKTLKDIFVDHIETLKGIDVKKIVMIPPHIMVFDDSAYSSVETHYPLGVDIDKQESRKHLKEVVRRRIQDGLELIDEKGLDLMVRMSGGNIRQLITIGYQASIDALVKKSPIIRCEHVESALDDLRSRMGSRLLYNPSRYEILAEVYQLGRPKTEHRDLNICLLTNMILAFKNGTLKMAINPLLKEQVVKWIEQENYQA